MFKADDTVVYKGHGLVKVTGKARKNFDGIEEEYYLVKSARLPIMQTKMMIKVDGAENVLRYPVSKEEAKEILDILGGEPAELPEDSKERMQILDDILQRNDAKELAALIRDYRETNLLNLERPEVKKLKSVSRNLAEELCHSLKVHRAALRGKLYVRPA